MRKETILTAAVLAALSANVYAAEITLENNHTAGSNSNLVSSVGNIKLDTDNGPTTNNLILGGWSKYTGNNIYNIFSGTEIAPENRNVENIAIGDVVKIKDSDYGLMIGNHITNENDADSIKKYGRRSTMIKGDYITVKNSPHATVLGQDSTVTNSYGAFVHGKDNVVENATWSVVMGQGATAKLTTAEKGGSVVIGQKANTNSNFTIALGASAAAKNYAATAIGGGSTATGKYSLAMAQADSNGYGSIGIGMNAVADKEDSVSLGVKSKAMGERATAIGKNANAATTDTISIGSCSGATGVDGTAIGHCAKAEGTSSIAMGTTSKAKAEDSVAIGHLAVAHSDLSTAIGKEAEASESGAIAVGYNAKASGMDSIAIGSSKTVPGDPNTSNTVAKGERGIAIGYEVDNEASNSIAIGSGASVKHQVDDDGMTHYATYSTVVGTGANSTRYGGTAYGYLAEVHGDDGVAVGHYATANGRRSNAIGYSAEAKADSSIAIGEDSEVNGEFGIAQGWQAKAEAESGIAIGKWAESKHVGSIALGSESRTADAVSTSSATINGKTYNFAGGEANSTLSIGVAKGVDEYGNEIKEVNRTITNVAAGRINDNSTDAVNGSQLHAVIKAVNEVAANDKDTITTVVAGDNIEVKADGNTYTVSTSKDLKGLNSINLNDGNNETNFNTKGIEMTYRGEGANGLEYHTTYNYNGMTIKTNDGYANPVSEISLTDKGLNNGGNRITNVGKGIDGTDGVNVKQLKDELAKNRAVESVITDNQIDNIAAVRVTNGKSTGEANAQYGVYVSKNTVTDIAKASNQFKGDDVIRVERTTGANHTADTTTFKFDGNEASKVIPISYKANGGTVNKVTAEKGFNFVDGNHIKASTDTNGVVRFDLDQEIPKQIERNTNNIEKITNRYDALTTKVAKNYKTAERGIAGTAALAALHPLDFDPDHKLDVMAGVGHFHGSNAVALGAAYRPNEDLMFTVGSTVGNGDTVLNAGVSYKVGAKSDVSRSKVAVAKDVADMKREMAEMKAQNAKITAILNTVLGVGLPEDQNVMFPDVPQNHWAFEAVDDLARRGLIIGYEDGLFKGDRTLTRYEFAEVVHRAIQRAKALNVPIDGRLVDEFKPELLRFEVEKNGSLERVHALKSNRDIKRDSYGTIVGVR